ncbi:hypothetical protein IB024_15145 [Brucella sp. 6810]|uniref:hypothetical protein n=1 Tax=Brucella sp. 6810 TaxID=2769351 RepID=UPI00165CAC4B|nr:hypothetical protein [Brucella sp. 6810]QNQ63583.1 hypothetical protein IB024_15145 [Brucella sp. 6810]
MFAPIGYISVHKLIYENLNIRWKDIFIREFENWVDLCDGDANKAIRSTLVFGPSDEAERMLFNEIKRNMFICSPAGDVFDFYPPKGITSDLCFEHVDPLMIASEIFCIEDGYVFPQEIIKLSRANLDEVRALSLKIFQDNSSGNSVRTTEYLRIASSGFLSIPTWYSRDGYVLSCHFMDWARSKMDNIIGSYFPSIDPLRKFEGWSLCVKDDFQVTDTLKSFLIGDVPLSDAQVAEKQNGRPAVLREGIASLYISRPEIFEQKRSWAWLARVLEREHGIIASKDTIKRAIGSAKATQN